MLKKIPIGKKLFLGYSSAKMNLQLQDMLLYVKDSLVIILGKTVSENCH